MIPTVQRSDKFCCCWSRHFKHCLHLYSKETTDEFEKLFVENEVLKDSITGLQQQYRSVSENHEVSVVAFNPVTLVRDWSLISLYSITLKSNVKVMRIKEI